jgi:hypothetical protein
MVPSGTGMLLYGVEGCRQQHRRTAVVCLWVAAAVAHASTLPDHPFVHPCVWDGWIPSKISPCAHVLPVAPCACTNHAAYMFNLELTYKTTAATATPLQRFLLSSWAHGMAQARTANDSGRIGISVYIATNSSYEFALTKFRSPLANTPAHTPAPNPLTTAPTQAPSQAPTQAPAVAAAAATAVGLADAGNLHRCSGPPYWVAHHPFRK